MCSRARRRSSLMSERNGVPAGEAVGLAVLESDGFAVPGEAVCGVLFCWGRIPASEQAARLRKARRSLIRHRLEWGTGQHLGLCASVLRDGAARMNRLASINGRFTRVASPPG